MRPVLKKRLILFNSTTSRPDRALRRGRLDAPIIALWMLKPGFSRREGLEPITSAPSGSMMNILRPASIPENIISLMCWSPKL